MIKVSDFPDLSKNALVQWQGARDEFPKVREQLAVIDRVTDRTQEHSGLSTLPTARIRDDGDDAYKGDLKQAFTKNFTQYEVALQVDVTKQLRKFDNYNKIMKRMREMGKSGERRLELDLAALLYHAWSTSYTSIDGRSVTVSSPDGNALIDSAHDVNGTSDTFSNEIDTTHDPIDVDVLEALEEKFNGLLDEGNGRNVPIMPDTIITGRHSPTVHTVRRILNSELLAGTANNDKNTFKAEYQHLIVPFLDVNPQTEARDSSRHKYAFLANLKDRDINGFRIKMSQDIMLEAPDQVFESSVWQFLTTALYDLGTTSAAFIAGTKGDGTSV